MQIIRKNGKVMCRTTVHYPPETIRQMKRAGYTVTEKNDATDVNVGNRKGRKTKNEIH